MPSFADSIFLFVLALLLFGPKRLPVLARELGKWVGEFRRASNEFKMQMEDELRASEQADRQKQIAAMEAAAPVPPRLEDAEPEHPHLRHMAATDAAVEAKEPTIMPPAAPSSAGDEAPLPASSEPSTSVVSTIPAPTYAPVETLDGVRPIPIAVSGDIRMMPPATGLPTPRSRNGNAPESRNNASEEQSDALGGLLDSIPETTPEIANHGD